VEHTVLRSVTRSIAAPAATAWRILADVERWPEWTPTVARVERLDDGPLGVGARVRIRQPKLFPAVWTITEWSPERNFTWAMRSPGVRVVADHAIRPGGSGCTVELRVGYGGILGGLVARLYGGLTERYMRMEADGLRAASERSS
jgi:uncharacterized protein YndB with AHSA1/START domain